MSKKFNLIFSTEAWADIKTIRKLLEAASLAEAVRRSVRLAKQILVIAKSGGKLVHEKDDGTREILIVVS